MSDDLLTSILQRTREAAHVARQYSSWGEEHKRLHPEVFAAIRQAGVSRLFLPTGLGGYAVKPSVCAQVTETLADGDPSAAWYVMVFNAARIMSSQWPRQLVEQLWANDPDMLVAASGHTPLQGTLDGDEYVVSGRNSFVSGCHYADFIMSPMLVDGQPHLAVIPQAQVQIIDNWDTLGMRATGSNDIVLDAIRLPKHFVAAQAPLDPAASEPHPAFAEDDLYACPSRVVFATYVPAALSLARRALEELESLARRKVPYATDHKLAQRSVAQIHYGRALAIYRSAYHYFFHCLDEVYDQAQQGASFDDRARADLYLAGTHAMQASAKVVQQVADAAGSSMFDKHQPLERIARDMETLRHHGFANESRFGSVAQVHWGVDLDYPLLLR